MNAPLDDRTYHVVPFDRLVEAQAFAAALRRVLNGPRGAPFVAAHEPAEIWLSPSELVEVYLSVSSFEAARTAFSPLPATTTRLGRDLPEGCVAMTAESLDPSPS